MSKRLFYIEDGRPNIVIVPTMSFSKSKPSTSTSNPENEPPVKKLRLNEIPLPVQERDEQFHSLNEPPPPGTSNMLSVPKYYGPVPSGISDLLPAQHFPIQNQCIPPSMPDLLSVQQVHYSNQPAVSRMPDFIMPTSFDYNMESPPLYDASTTSQLNVLVEKSPVHCSMSEPTQYDIASTKCLTSCSTFIAATNILPDKTNETEVVPQAKVTSQKSSWASNYMMSIGQPYRKEIKINLSSSKKKLFLSQGTSEKRDENSSKEIEIAEKILKNGLNLHEKNEINEGVTLSVDSTQKETERSILNENDNVVETLQTQKKTTPDNSSMIPRESPQIPDMDNKSGTASYKAHKPKSYRDGSPRNQSHCREDARYERHSREKNISHKRERQVSRERHDKNYDSYKHRHSNDRYSPGYSRSSQSRVSEDKNKKLYRSVDTHESHKRRDYPDKHTSRTSSETKVATKSCVIKRLCPNTRKQSKPETRSDICETSSSGKSKSSQSSPLKSIVITKDHVKSPENIESALDTFDLRSKLSRKNVRDSLSHINISDETRKTLNKMNFNISEQVRKTLHERFGNIYQKTFPNKDSNQVESLKISVSTDNKDQPIKPNVEKTAPTYKADTGTSEKSQNYQNRKNGKKRKNIKLVIQVICDESDSSDSVEVVESTDFCRLPNEDLSFLDDLNIDEIVDTLKRCNAEPNTPVMNNNIVYDLVSDDEISNASTVQLEELNDILEDITATDDEKKPFELKNEATTSSECKESSSVPQQHQAYDKYIKVELKEPLFTNDIENKPIKLNGSSTEDVVIKHEKNITDEDKHEILRQVNIIKKTEIKQETPDIALQTNASLLSNITMTDIYRNLDKTHYNICKVNGNMDVCSSEPITLNSEIKQEPLADIPDMLREVPSDVNVIMTTNLPKSPDIIYSLKETPAMNVDEKEATGLNTEIVEESALRSGLPINIVEDEPNYPELELNSHLRDCSKSPNINKTPLEKNNLPRARDEDLIVGKNMEIKQEPLEDIPLPPDMLQEVLSDTINSSKGNADVNVNKIPGSIRPAIIIDQESEHTVLELNSQMHERVQSPNTKENPVETANERSACISKLPDTMDNDLIANQIVMKNTESDTHKECHDSIKEVLMKACSACEEVKLTENLITTEKSNALGHQEVIDSESGNIDFTTKDTEMEEQTIKVNLIEKSKDGNANNMVHIPGNEPTATVTENNETFTKSQKATEKEKKENSTEETVKVTFGEMKSEPLNKIKTEPSKLSRPSADIVPHNKTTTTSKNAKSNNSVSSSSSHLTIKTPSLGGKTLSGDLPNFENNLVATLERNMTEKLKDSFKMASVICKGRFSEIYHFKNSTGKNYVIKYLRDNTLHTGILKKNMLEDLQKDIPAENQYILGWLNSFTVKHKYCLVMEYFPKNLAQILKSRKGLCLDIVLCLSKQLVTAVNVLRQKNVIHADIKPEHILVNDSMNKLKLCGFDSAFYFEQGPPRLLLSIGTVNYRAPENILGYPADFSMDVWSTALVMFEMSAGRKLFPGGFNNDIIYKQMCTSGYIPMDMILQSRNSKKHFIGNTFKRRFGRLPHEYILQNEFQIEYNDVLKSTLISYYYYRWGKGLSKTRKGKEVSKINQLILLLQQMLAIHPQSRMPIEFVYADPFFS